MNISCADPRAPVYSVGIVVGELGWVEYGMVMEMESLVVRCEFLMLP